MPGCPALVVVDAMSTACVTPSLVRAAQGALRAEPSLCAVLLFGSRARGDHEPDSDWDIALVTTGAYEAERSSVAPAGWEFAADDGAFDFLRISGAHLSRKANALTHIACPIAREAVLLAGEWTPPPLHEPAMEADEYGRKTQRVMGLLEAACDDLARLPTKWSRRSDLAKCAQILGDSAYAAEELVKGMLGRRGRTPERTHELTDLAAMFDDDALREVVLALDGHVRGDHRAGYDARPTPEQMRRAVKRLADTVALFLSDLREALGDPRLGTVAREDMRQARASVRRFAAELRAAGDGADALSEGGADGSLDAAVVAALQGRTALAEWFEATLARDARASARHVRQPPRPQRAAP